MTGDAVPDDDHVARYCPYGRLALDGQPTATAFELKPDEETLSVNWLEFFDFPNRREQIAALRDEFASGTGLRLGPLGRLAVLNVGAMRAEVQSAGAGRDLQVLHEPTVKSPSHSSIYGLQPEEQMIRELLAELARQEVYSAVP